MNFFDFLYCCFYRWSERVNGKTYPHKYSASIMMSFILMLIGGAIFSAIVTLSGLDVLSFPAGRIGAGLFTVAIFAVAHWHFTSDDRHLKTLKAFDTSNNRFRGNPGLVVAIVLVASLALLFSLWVLLAHSRTAG